MNILYIGDVMGDMGLETIDQILPMLRLELKVDLVIAQAENTTDGRGINPDDFQRLRKAGVDFCTGGNWSLYNDSIIPTMKDPLQGIIRPANYPVGTPGLGYKYAQTPRGQVLVVSLLGHIVGKDADKPIDNPLKVIDRILEAEKDVEKAGIVVNFHGDYSSEKVVIGHYLDGKVSLVVGDHWHVPTADASILPKGTAHQSDVGMVGALNASLGVGLGSVLPRWRDNRQTRNVLETMGQKQFNAVLVTVNEQGLADSVERIQRYID